MANEFDDLEAVKKIVESLEGFKPEEQERIIRWARERIGLDLTPLESARRAEPPDASLQTPRRAIDIKSFVASKNPKADTHFAATVAYYYKFEAPIGERKEFIAGDDLQDACRRVGRERLANPGQTLRNAHHSGLLDKGSDAGIYCINTVGENLVAMTLPRSD